MDRKENQSPQREMSRVLIEFLEVAITSIVFLKGIFPPGAFESCRYMNLVVHRARHPQLNHYIHKTLSTLLPFIHQGLVERVAVIFCNNHKIPIEKFMFKINVNQSHGITMEDAADLESSLKSLLVKLSQSEPLSKTVSEDLRWEITGYFRSLPEAGSSKDADTWIPTNAQQWQQPPIIMPIKSINLEPISMQLYLEHPSHLEPMP